MRYDAASVGTRIRTFRGKIMFSSSRVKMSQGKSQHIPGKTEEHNENLRIVGVPEKRSSEITSACWNDKMIKTFLVVRLHSMLQLNLHVRRTAEYNFSWITWWGVYADAAGPHRPPLILSRRDFLLAGSVSRKKNPNAQSSYDVNGCDVTTFTRTHWNGIMHYIIYCSCSSVHWYHVRAICTLIPTCLQMASVRSDKSYLLPPSWNASLGTLCAYASNWISNDP